MKQFKERFNGHLKGTSTGTYFKGYFNRLFKNHFKGNEREFRSLGESMTMWVGMSFENADLNLYVVWKHL